MVAMKATLKPVDKDGDEPRISGFAQEGYVEKEKPASSFTLSLCKGDCVTLLTHAHLNR